MTDHLVATGDSRDALEEPFEEDDSPIIPEDCSEVERLKLLLAAEQKNRARDNLKSQERLNAAQQDLERQKTLNAHEREKHQEDALKAQQRLNTAQEDLERQKTALTQERKKHQEDALKAQQRLNTAQEDLERQKTFLAQERARSQTSLDSLQQQLKEERAHRAEETAKSQALLTQAKGDYLLLRGKNADLETQLALARRDLQQARDQGRDERERRETLHRDALTLEQQKAQGDALRSQRENARLQSELADTRLALTNARGEIGQLRLSLQQGGKSGGTMRYLFLGALLGGGCILLLGCGLISAMMGSLH